MQHQFLEVNGATLHVQIEGNAAHPTLLLSNGLGTNSNMWSPQMPAFMEYFQVVRYDVRGHGKSMSTPGDYSIALLAHDALGILDTLKIDKAYFCGLSMGGMIGQWIGAHAPERLSRMVLSNTGSKLGTVESWNDRIASVHRDGMEGLVEPSLARWLTPMFMERHPEATARIREMMLTTSMEGYIGCCAAIRDMDLTQSTQNIAVPTLVIGGLDDHVTTPGDANRLAKSINGATLMLLAAAHLANFERPSDYTDAVLNFLKG